MHVPKCWRIGTRFSKQLRFVIQAPLFFMRNKLVTAVISILLFLGANIVLADHSEGESPNEALSEILDLYKSHNWEGIVQQRCLDTQYAESRAAVNVLVENLRNRISDAETYQSVVSSYEAALIIRPKFESDGSVAVFSSPQGSITLSKMDTGVWGLRL